MFGVLTVTETRMSAGGRLLLRLFPGRGLRLTRGCWRMALWETAALTVPPGLSAQALTRRVRRALRALRASGARPLCVPERWRAEARALGLTPLETAPLLRACAAAAYLRACRAAGLPPEKTAVLVSCAHADRVLADEVLALARTVRTVRLRAPVPLPLLRERLLRARGIAAEGPLPPEAIPCALVLAGAPDPRAVLAVDLTEEAHAPWGMPALRPRPLPPPGVSVPPGADAPGFLAGLCFCGGLPAREIGLDITADAPYNKESQIEHAPAERQAIRVEGETGAGPVVLSPRETS